MEAASSWKQAVLSWNFWLSAFTVGSAVTWVFYANGDGAGVTSMDGLLYWSVYFVCLTFLLFVILMFARRQERTAAGKAS